MAYLIRFIASLISSVEMAYDSRMHSGHPKAEPETTATLASVSRYSAKASALDICDFCRSAEPWLFVICVTSGKR